VSTPRPTETWCTSDADEDGLIGLPATAKDYLLSRLAATVLQAIFPGLLEYALHGL
jgi:hypothetical protein